MPGSSTEKYYLTYKIEPHPEGIARADLDKNDGACDAILLTSILFPADGSYSSLFVSLDGRTGKDLSEDEIFKVWFMLAARLKESASLSPNKRELCRAIFEMIRSSVLAGRAEKDGAS